MILHHKSAVIFYKKHSRRTPVTMMLRTAARDLGDSMLFKAQYKQHKPKPARAGSSQPLAEYEQVNSIKTTDSSIPAIPSFRLCFITCKAGASFLVMTGRQKGSPAQNDANTDILFARKDMTRYTRAVFFNELSTSFLLFVSITAVLSQFLFDSFQRTFFKS